METAFLFKEAGAKWIHMVDLDGAVQGKGMNSEIFIAIAKETGLNVEFGGGIRSLEDVEFYLNNGIQRVVLGSAAVNNPQLIREAVQAFGDRICVGIDARGGKVATEGWANNTSMDYIELACRMEGIGVQYIAFTDIQRDGTMKGPNLLQLEALNAAVDCNIIASGGVSCMEDVKNLYESNVYGAICGKAVYSGALNLREAIEKYDF